MTAPPGQYFVTIRVHGKLTSQWMGNYVSLEAMDAQKAWTAGPNLIIGKQVGLFKLTENDKKSELPFDETYKVFVITRDNAPTRTIFYVQPVAFVAKGQVSLEWTVAVTGHEQIG